MHRRLLIVQDTMLTVDTVKECFAPICQARVFAFDDLVRGGVALVVVAAGEEMVVFDAHAWWVLVFLSAGAARVEASLGVAVGYIGGQRQGLVDAEFIHR